MFLDHDLGGEISVSTDNKNAGSEVARWLSEHEKRKPKIIILHTLNMVGQKYMKSLLPESVMIPFIWVKVSSENLTKETIEQLKKLAEQQNTDLQYVK